MERKKKYTHITARVNGISKLVSQVKLKHLCNYTLSDAYWRMDEGKGLLHTYDQESFNIWSDLMNLVAKISSPVPMSKVQHEELCGYRNNVWKKMEEYRTWIDQGTCPTQFHVYAGEAGVSLPFLQNAIESLIARGEDILSIDIKEALSIAQKSEGTYIDSNNKRVEAGEIETFHVPQEIRSSTYQIRADYSHKKSDSELIRSRLDGIWDLTPKTNEAHRAIYAENYKVLKDFEKWKTLKIKKDYLDLLGYLQSIKVPPIETPSLDEA